MGGGGVFGSVILVMIRPLSINRILLQVVLAKISQPQFGRRDGIAVRGEVGIDKPRLFDPVTTLFHTDPDYGLGACVAYSDLRSEYTVDLAKLLSIRFVLWDRMLYPTELDPECRLVDQLEYMLVLFKFYLKNGASVSKVEEQLTTSDLPVVLDINTSCIAF